MPERTLDRLRLKGGMSVKAQTDGLLKALQGMREVDRSNIVEHLPPEKVRDAFLLLLREQDGAPGTFNVTAFSNNADLS